MYFPDLSPYEYGEPPSRAGVVLNVGWLEPTDPFPSGPVPGGLLTSIATLCEQPVNLTRGYHGCGFCALEIRATAGERADGRQMLQALETRRALGNGEIMVAGEGKVHYMAPVLIRHYIDHHRYQPPPEFIAAVMSPPELRR
jgi:hypothetical protein